ncbi:prepilin-type N-terminal cleavage/methylation domain-containing protein [Candidatus Sumerlaeota bacterium]|nr:prepilin-type N-terminal cleavage/methylation domain-containing protein [Candidatus Sumerlaeota bacterium]MBI3737183.1 prepilin-type N-terminal cleavage/methylation domain-containing protein [Candidatus Sumerlaeota bacterium]
MLRTADQAPKGAEMQTCQTIKMNRSRPNRLSTILQHVGGMFMCTQRHPATRRRRGFTAIELTAVASIIAILALILIPIVRKRLESARLAAAQDDMRSIEVAEMLANADTAYFFRLSDLDNPAADIDTFNNPPNAVAKAQSVRSVPNGTWNRNFSVGEQADQNKLGLIGATWNGPYTTFNKGKFVALNSMTGDLRFRVVNIDVVPGTTSTVPITNAGPIPIFTSATGGADPFNDDLTNQEVTPIDPWGLPYIFFGPGRIGVQAGQTAISNFLGVTPETNFGISIVYSTGPNGLPGNIVPSDALPYFRQTGILGTDDDLYRIF